jgi:hypothetical protein
MFLNIYLSAYFYLVYFALLILKKEGHKASSEAVFATIYINTLKKVHYLRRVD